MHVHTALTVLMLGSEQKKDHGGLLRGKRVLVRPLVLHPISSDVLCLPVPTLLSMCDAL